MKKTKFLKNYMKMHETILSDYVVRNDIAGFLACVKSRKLNLSVANRSTDLFRILTWIPFSFQTKCRWAIVFIESGADFRTISQTEKCFSKEEAIKYLELLSI